MRHQRIFLSLLTICGLATTMRVLAVDGSPVSKQNSVDIGDRFSLVGVIAEGGPHGGGIAVIRDQVQGKTHTLRVGEVIPGTHDAVLKSVARQKAVIASEGRDWQVGVASGEVATNSSDIAESQSIDSGNYDDDEDVDAPGLFERWYQSRVSSVLSPTLDGISERDGRRAEPFMPMVMDMRDVSGEDERDRADRDERRLRSVSERQGPGVQQSSREFTDGSPQNLEAK